MIARPLFTLALVVSALATVQHASAQSTEGRPPQECGMTEEAARYGALEPGTVVTLQRHRFVSGDDNWDDQMARWLGRAARVTRVSGVDAAGCPGVRVDVDGGQWFWRVRDLGIGTGPQPRPETRAPSAAGIPQQCRQDEMRPNYGPISTGTEVVLGRHRMVDGDDNWADEMQQFVGRRARVVELSGIDGVGCPGVRVDIDSRQWFWRVRDLRLGSGGEAGAGGGGLVASTGVSSDHGRPASVVAWGSGGGGGGGLFGTGGSPTPQECGLTDATVQWGPIAVGASVTIGRHRPVNGDENWSAEMDPFVGRQARVQQLIGVDDQGCPVVHIDLDQGQWFWRVRDMTVP
ncbi:hypothetical protein [Sandaracinus amylolyticus]|uniref:hypothetical protein n=1 Tax=Sandaracinus amylolyticus TaxID=927083 RepID=UPI001F38F66D|nr:hypothetical protein [Sandaracinus amylolyticus]UJR82434.1 Hypothetical protein I5071_44990 [Sandaracinus amylolyticus]